MLLLRRAVIVVLTPRQRINHLRDQLAASQLDLDRRELEIEQLNEELDAKVKDHEKEIQEVTAEWRNEALEARAQVDELRDVSFINEFGRGTDIVAVTG